MPPVALLLSKWGDGLQPPYMAFYSRDCHGVLLLAKELNGRYL
jgi:hypothetical protein